MNTQRAHLVVAWGVLSLLTGPLRAEDWTQWRGPNRDNVVTGFNVPKEWPKELKKNWTVQLGSGDAGPVLLGDRVFVYTRQGDQEVMTALDAKTGDKLWEEKNQAVAVSGPPGSHPGPRGTPSVAEGKVYGLGVGGILTCWDAATGAVVWRKDSKEFPKQWPSYWQAMSPIVVDKLCIAHLGAEGNGALIAFDAATGEEKWRWSEEGPSSGSPVVATIGGVKQIVSEAAKSIVGIAVSDGKLLWRNPYRGQPSGTPIVSGDTIYYTVSGTNAIKIVKEGDEFKVETLWAQSAPAPKWTTPVLKNGFLYGALQAGQLYCMDAKTGKVNWTDNARRGDPAAILDVGPVLLTVGANSELSVFAPNENEYQEVAKIQVADSPVWSYPILSGNRLYVKDKDSLTLWTLE